MTTNILIKCVWCGFESLKPSKEINRRLRNGKNLFFCNNTCSAYHHNSRDHIRSLNRKNAIKYFLPLIHDPQHASKAKYGKEGWKYAKVEKFLSRNTIDYWFEYPILNEENCVRLYDLCLPQLNTIIEFDGKYHKRTEARPRDIEKELLAEKHGFRVIRISTSTNEIIPEECVRSLFREDLVF